MADEISEEHYADGVLSRRWRRRPGGRHGDFAEFTQLHPALLRWIEANGYGIVGPSREIYVQHDTRHAENSVTEVQYPVAKE